jgi:hypothetical protein
VSVEDRCTVCTKYTTGLEIILDAHDKTTGNMGLMESQFGLFEYSVTIIPFGDSDNVDARQVHVLR